MIPLSQLPRFRVTYVLLGRTYEICTPAPNAAHIWQHWDSARGRIDSVVEVDRNNLTSK